MAAGHAGAVLGAANSVAPHGADQLKDCTDYRPQRFFSFLEIPDISPLVTLQVSLHVLEII